LLAYLVSMTLRIVEIHRVLKPTGSFYLHCDPTASHYLKLVIDAIFCVKGGDFRNEIIWGYIAPSAAKKDFPRKHDVIFRYTKSNTFTFNADAIRIPYSEEFIKRRKYSEGKSGIYAEKSSGRDEDDLTGFAKGKLPPSWWTDIKSGGQIPRKELLGYPTQKPEALLERIIKASSNEGDVILDAYCGCGTTVAVAQKLNRQWIGIDITYQSISLILKRLEEHNADSLAHIELNGVPKDFDSAVALANKKDDRTRKEFEKWMILTYSKNQAVIHEKKGSDAGIDGIAYISDRNDKGEIESKKVLFSVKSNKTLTSAVVRELNGIVERDQAACGVLLTLHPMPNLVKESKQYGYYHNVLVNKDYPKIQVACVEDIFNGSLIELPNVMKVLKDAEQHAEQEKLL